MPVLTQFSPPAHVNDFEPGESALEQRFRAEWNTRVQRWMAIGAVGDAWDSNNDAPRARFFSPLGLDPALLIQPSSHAWTAFPKRLLDAFEATHTLAQMRKFADDGPPQPYSPGGPRGWQDEYCEWAVERNSAGKITKVTFTCENPEYWETLWFVSPEKVRDLYRKYTGDTTIQVADLALLDTTGAAVIDPDTGRPSYNRRNPWNRNRADGGRNGVMHLISPPNNLFAEIYLAAAATILRKKPDHEVTDRDELIACGNFGSPGRNSDPSIGFYVNDLVRANNIEASLADPIGLYIEGLSTTGFTLPSTAPAGTNPLDFWKIMRGTGDMILRAEYSVPAALGFTVSDIKINGDLITTGAQLAEKIQVKLTGLGRAVAGPLPTSLSCVGSRPVAQRLPHAITFFIGGQGKEKFSRGETHRVGLFCTNSPAGAAVQVSGTGITITVVNRVQDVDPDTGDTNVELTVDLHIAADAAVGLRDVAIKVGGNPPGPASPALFEVVDAPLAGPTGLVPPVAGAVALRVAAPDLPIEETDLRNRATFRRPQTRTSQ